MGKERIQRGIHNYTDEEHYVAPKEEEVREKISWFMGLKLGLMIHWGPGCQLGTYESWPLCDGDGEWSQSEIDWTDVPTFKKQYEEANRTFCPIRFRPDKWAQLAWECGFKYLLFTTKHHDGFCMFDTDTTDYKITDPSCPFHSNPNADVTGALYREFRKRGMAISVYFSKPDWHCDYYWHRAFGLAPTRNVNYDVRKYPQLWEKFVEYTHTQIRELCSDYGPVDVLWLDGGWVNPECENQDIRLGELVRELREKTPGLIVCDRSVGGEFENIVTPEKTIPETAMPIPWETCATTGNRFAFQYTDDFKTGAELVALLLEVAAKGGNLALNVAPQPDGAFPKPVVESLKELGGWLKSFGGGIYETSPVFPYVDEKLFYTAHGEKRYVFLLLDGEGKMPEYLEVYAAEEIGEVRCMRTGAQLPFIQKGTQVKMSLKEVPEEGSFAAEGFELRAKKD